MTRPREAVSLVMITGDDCPLCDEMKAEIRATQTAVPFHLVELPVHTTPDLISYFGTRYPYLFVSGHSFAKGRVDRQKLSVHIAAFGRAFSRKELPDIVLEGLKKIGSPTGD